MRTLIAIAASHGWDIHAMDVVSAFSNSILKETIYIELPEGFDEEKKAGKVARLREALFGLKQSAKCWSDEIKEKFTSMKMKRNPLDHCLWRRKDDDGEVLVYLHVDDMAVTGDNIQKFKAKVKSRWNIEDLGPAKKIVGIELTRKQDGGYKINQESMISNTVKKFGMKESKPFTTPVPGGIKVFKATEAEAREMKEKGYPYRSVVGSLMYISIGTRPDITFAVGVLLQHLETPLIHHWNLEMHILRYLC